MLLLAFLGGVLTILSPCILPVIPLVFARANRELRREVIPMLGGLAVAFTSTTMLATVAARWLLLASEVGRYAALVLLGAVGLSLLSTRFAGYVSRPVVLLGGALVNTPPVATPASTVRHIVIGMAIGLLWAPCAGPILGLIIAAAASGAAPRAGLLLFTFSLGATVSLAVVAAAGSRLVAVIKGAGIADAPIRRTLGVATVVTVLAILLGWDQALFAKGGLVKTAHAEALLVTAFAPHEARTPDAGMSLDAFAADQAAVKSAIALPSHEGMLPGFSGGTEWINSGEITAESLKGKVVLVEFWTFACYNCLNALPHVKDLYAKYKDRGFVVIGVHTPELSHERLPENVRREVKRLGITYPVVIDNTNRIWDAYKNQYWPAAYFADATGKLRFHHFGEGRYQEQDQVVARLLAERDAATLRGEH